MQRLWSPQGFARPLLVLSLSLLAVANAGGRLQTQTTHVDEDRIARETWLPKAQATRDERIAWWRDARFGMFIHWGVYSGLGGEWHGKKGGGYAEHIQRVLKIPIPEYRKEV